MTSTEQKTRYLRLRDAVMRKYGCSDDLGRRRVVKNLQRRPHLQPWAGYCYNEGRLSYWPEDAIEEWASVFDHNREEYLRGLLAHPDRSVREGVRAQLANLYDAGRLPEAYHDIVEGL